MTAFIHILDVGHGNCAVISENTWHAVIDSPSTAVIFDYLAEFEISTIDVVIVSHADDDHIAGITMLLTDPNIIIRRLYINPDAKKSSDSWYDFRVAVGDAIKRHSMVVMAAWSAHDVGRDKTVRLEIVGPSVEMSLSGAGGRALDGSPIDSNAMSVVVRVWFRERPIALFCGDVSGVGLQDLLVNLSLQADVLIFPHHGGHLGSSKDVDSIETLLRSVQPQAVVFSNGRMRYWNPLPATVAKLLQVLPESRVLCTQLSRHCAESVDQNQEASRGLPGAGKRLGYSCAGTIDIRLTEDGRVAIAPEPSVHMGLIDRCAPSALCRAKRKS